MEPRIQYAKTADGVSIAFCTLGEGPPLVHMPSIPGHIQMEWQIPEWRGWYERLTQKRRLVRYDGRGSGLSERDVADYSLEAHVADLEAVVDRLGLERFALLGWIHSGPVAIAYAARHSERVSHLVLWCTYARNIDYQRSPQVQALRALRETLADQDQELFSQTWADLFAGPSPGDLRDRFAAYFRESATPKDIHAVMRATFQFDVESLLPQVRSPTLVLARRQVRLVDVGVARGLCSRIPNARLVVLEGASPLPFLDDTERVVMAIDEFLGEGEEVAAAAEPPAAGGLCTILFTDVEGSTALTQRLGDAKAREVLREHERMTREALRAHGGTEVKTMGDGFMASFSSATRALECAIAMQQAFAEHNAGVGAQSAAGRMPLLIRIGLNAGEPIAEDEDLFGTAVNLAARIAAKAEGGEVLASDVVRQLVAGKGFLFSDRGDVVLRGFEDPVRLYEVRWRD